MPQIDMKTHAVHKSQDYDQSNEFNRFMRLLGIVGATVLVSYFMFRPTPIKEVLPQPIADVKPTPTTTVEYIPQTAVVPVTPQVENHVHVHNHYAPPQAIVMERITMPTVIQYTVPTVIHQIETITPTIVVKQTPTDCDTYAVKHKIIVDKWNAQFFK
jgi:hypothetical protein